MHNVKSSMISCNFTEFTKISIPSREIAIKVSKWLPCSGLWSWMFDNASLSTNISACVSALSVTQTFNLMLKFLNFVLYRLVYVLFSMEKRGSPTWVAGTLVLPPELSPHHILLDLIRKLSQECNSQNSNTSSDIWGRHPTQQPHILDHNSSTMFH